MIAKDGFDVPGRGVHEIATGATVDVNVDKPGRYIKAMRIDHLRTGRNVAPRTHGIDAVALNQHHAVRNHAAIDNDGSVEESFHYAGNRRLRQNLFHYFAADIGKPEIAPLKLIREARVVDTHQVENRRVQIVHADRILRHVV